MIHVWQKAQGITTYDFLHVVHLNCSYKKKTVNDYFTERLKKTYGKHGKVKEHRKNGLFRKEKDQD